CAIIEKIFDFKLLFSVLPTGDRRSLRHAIYINLIVLDGSVELYIHYEGVNIFSINLSDPKNVQPEIDAQLISGFLMANSLFFDEMLLGNNAKLLRILRGDSEIRMWIGDTIHATLILKGLPYLDLKAYYELDVLTKSIIHQFETHYLEEIETFILKGHFTFDGIEAFIENEVIKMKSHMNSAYIMHILGLNINSNVKRKESTDLLISLNSQYAHSSIDYQEIQKYHGKVCSTLQNYAESHPTIIKNIKKVNQEHTQIWKLFQVPLI
ncbi:MAG: hypothetical protein KAR20_29440, partial [Candidatus Heimdallarchaeota archaeon]|nr:hypothetical protein [Candidatus Heimdallarchaeota archaeon]